MTADTQRGTVDVPAVRRAVDASVAAALARRRPDGSWDGVLSPSAVATGSAMIALHLYDRDRSAALVAAGARWLRGAQDADGGWGDDVGAPATVNATGVALAALALVDDGGSSACVRAAEAALARMGGEDAVADPRRCSLRGVVQYYLSLSGRYPPGRVGRVPGWVMLLPAALRTRLSFTMPGVASWGLAAAGRGPVGRLERRRALGYLAGLRRFAQEAGGPHDGGLEESPLMTSCVVIGLARAGRAPDQVAGGLAYLRATARPDGSWAVDRDMNVSVTGFLSVALAAAGAAGPADAAWLRGAQRGAFPATGAPAGGWGWSLPSGWPNSGDTAATMLALHALGVDPGPEAASYLRTVQNRDGSWSCFRRNASLSLDAPCAVMTADAVSALHLAGGVAASDPVLERAVRWFGSVQRDDGAVATTRWYRGTTVGTAHVLRALGDLGRGESPVAVRCRAWLLAHQAADGGFGDALGHPTVEETAWSAIALSAAPGPDGRAAARRALGYLVERQRPDGRWPAALLGVYFLDVGYAYDEFADALALRALTAGT